MKQLRVRAEKLEVQLVPMLCVHNGCVLWDGFSLLCWAHKLFLHPEEGVVAFGSFSWWYGRRGEL